MFNFFKSITEFNNLAKSINAMNLTAQDILSSMKQSHNKSELAQGVLVLAYIAKKSVFDRMEKYEWAMDTKIIVPAIDNGYITLTYALMNTLDKVSMIAAELEMSDIVGEVMDGGDAYYKLEKTLPDQIKNIF